MRFKLFGFLIALVFGLGAAPAPLFAADGELKEKVIGVIEANARGECPEELMAPVLLSACEQQIDGIQKGLKKMGAIEKAQYKGIERLQNGIDAEVYQVTFEHGSMVWLAALACSIETRPTRPSGALRLDLEEVCFLMVVGF